MQRPPFRRWRLLHRIKLAERRDETTTMQKLGYELMKHVLEATRQEVRRWRQKHPDGDAALGNAHI